VRRAEPHWIKIRINHPGSVVSQGPITPMGAARIKKPSDTVGELKSAEIYVSDMPSLKAKKLGKRPQEKVLLER
jgi:hypothetical protein